MELNAATPTDPDEPAAATLAEYMDREDFRRHLEAILPAHLKPERFLSIGLRQLSKTPKLGECTLRSVVAANMELATLGLEADVQGEAWLVPYNVSRWNEGLGRKVKRMEAQAQVGVWGHLKLAHNSGRISGVQMDVVMEGDRWEFEKGLNPKLLHVPRPDRDLEDIDRIRWVYVVVAADGAQWQPVGSGGTQVEMRAKGVYFDAFNRQWVERIRKRAQSYDSPAWSDWYAEMCMAKALKRVLKSCPKSREMAQAIGMTDELDANLEQGQTWNVDASKVLPANLAVDPKTQAARDAFAGAGKAPGREPEPEAVTVSASPSSSEAQKQEQGPERAGPQPEAGPEKAAPATTGGGLGWDD